MEEIKITTEAFMQLTNSVSELSIVVETLNKKIEFLEAELKKLKKKNDWTYLTARGIV